MDENDRFTSRPRVRIEGAGRTSDMDDIAREEPLELRIDGVSVAVVMRTPGDDHDLAAGFLLTERIVPDLSAVETIRHCDVIESPEAEDNVIVVRLRDGSSLDLQQLRRNLFASSSCGVCGKATLESALAHGPALASDITLSRQTLMTFPATLRTAQDTFARTGGLHGITAFDAEGRAIVTREDVGRHNALDKVVGALARAGQDAAAIMVSGRVSYEVVQKALAARIPIVAAVSAPTSLAIDLARACGITLVGFLRGETMNIYAGEERIV